MKRVYCCRAAARLDHRRKGRRKGRRVEEGSDCESRKGGDSFTRSSDLQYAGGREAMKKIGKKMLTKLLEHVAALMRLINPWSENAFEALLTLVLVVP